MKVKKRYRGKIADQSADMMPGGLGPSDTGIKTGGPGAGPSGVSSAVAQTVIQRTDGCLIMFRGIGGEKITGIQSPQMGKVTVSGFIFGIEFAPFVKTAVLFVDFGKRTGVQKFLP